MLDPVAMPHLADIPRVQGEKLSGKPAIWFEGKTTTFSELDTNANQIANGLIAAGVEPGDRVAYLAKNMGCYYEQLFGCAKARAAMTGINNRLAPPAQASQAAGRSPERQPFSRCPTRERVF